MKRFLLRALLLFVAGVVIVLIYQLLPSFSSKSQLSQIISIETRLLKEWQQRNGLKNNLTYTDTGNDVSFLQKMLSQDSSLYPEGIISGYYGEKTTSAIKKFQEEQGLPITGSVDVDTRVLLNKIFLSHLCPEASRGVKVMDMHKITKQTPVSLEYVPPRLIDVSNKVPSVGVACVQENIVPDLVQMFTDAKSDGVALMITSGYRKPEIQQYLYDFWLRIEGSEAQHEVALPGFSEHQLGTTVDLTDESIGYAGVDDRFSESKGGLWLREHAHLYGFSMSFPENKEEITGFTYEPWHWRYVGVTTANALRLEDRVFNEI